MKKAFKKSGIYPFDAGNIELSRVLPSIAVSSSSQEQLWNPTEPTATEIEPQNAVNVAVATLQQFENELGATLLNAFRSSAEVWNGSKEYSILFSVWKRIYKKATESISEDAVPLVLNVVHIGETLMDVTEDGNFHFINDDDTWIMEVNTHRYIFHRHYLFIGRNKIFLDSCQ